MDNDNDGHHQGEALTITSVTQPELATVEISAAGDYLIFTPQPGFSGGEFQYILSDGLGQTATSTVYVEAWEYDFPVEDPDYFWWYDAHAHDTDTASDSPALELAQAMANDPALVVGADFEALPEIANSYGLGTTPLGAFDSPAARYAILSTGDASLVNDPGHAASYRLNGTNVRGDSDLDVTILRIDLEVPAGANQLSFHFQFLSEEFPAPAFSRGMRRRPRAATRSRSPPPTSATWLPARSRCP